MGRTWWVMALAGIVSGLVACGSEDANEPARPTSSQASITTAPAPISNPAGQPLAGRVVVIDPGHNGRNGEHLDEISRLVDIGTRTKPCNTTGTSAAGGLTEAQLNWDVAVRTVEHLQFLGAEVLLTRQDNDGWGPCIDRRAAVGNAAGADAVVSIHADGGPAEGRGFHVIYPQNIPGLTDDIAEPSRILAVILRDAVAGTDMPPSDYTATDGLSERNDLGGLNLSEVPAVFLEMGNMKNADDLALLTDPTFQGRIATAIGAALEEFLTG